MPPGCSSPKCTPPFISFGQLVTQFFIYQSTFTGTSYLSIDLTLSFQSVKVGLLLIKHPGWWQNRYNSSQCYDNVACLKGVIVSNWPLGTPRSGEANQRWLCEGVQFLLKWIDGKVLHSRGRRSGVNFLIQAQSLLSFKWRLQKYTLPNAIEAVKLAIVVLRQKVDGNLGVRCFRFIPTEWWSHLSDQKCTSDVSNECKNGQKCS